MLERLHDLPTGVHGIRASGKVTEEDYERVVVPLLEEARSAGIRIRLLYHFGPEFQGFSAGGAWEDMRVGLHYLRLFERCAVVSDREWIRNASRAIGAVLPCPVRVFADAEWEDAASWLSEPAEGATLTHRLLPDRGVLVVEPHGKLRREDIDLVAMAVDPWIEANGELDGLVIHARKFPGWKDVGSFFRHFQFVRDHHRKIRRVALAAEGRVAEVGPALLDNFVGAELKGFDFDELDRAIEWAGKPRRQEPLAAP